MMYLVELEREIELQPCFFGPRLREVLEQKLHSEVDICTSRLLRRPPHLASRPALVPAVHVPSIKPFQLVHTG